MVHRGNWHPDVGIVAILANVGRLDMRRALASRIRAVMATGAVVHNIDMVKIGRQPGDRRVAVVTIIAAGDMCRVLAGGRDTVMT